ALSVGDAPPWINPVTYFPARLASEVVERTAFGIADIPTRMLAGTKAAMGDEKIREDIMPQGWGWLNPLHPIRTVWRTFKAGEKLKPDTAFNKKLVRALEITSQPELYAPVMSQVSKYRQKMHASAWEKNWKVGMANDITETGVDIAGLLISLFFAKKVPKIGKLFKPAHVRAMEGLTAAERHAVAIGVGGFRTPIHPLPPELLKLASRIKQYAPFAKRPAVEAAKAIFKRATLVGLHGALTTPGDDERVRAFSWRWAYNMTPALSGALGLAHVGKVIAVDALLNTGISMGLYKTAFERAGGWNEDFLKFVGPQLATDIGFALSTRTLPGKMRTAMRSRYSKEVLDRAYGVGKEKNAQWWKKLDEETAPWMGVKPEELKEARVGLFKETKERQEKVEKEMGKPSTRVPMQVNVNDGAGNTRPMEPELANLSGVKAKAIDEKMDRTYITGRAGAKIKWGELPMVVKEEISRQLKDLTPERIKKMNPNTFKQMLYSAAGMNFGEGKRAKVFMLQGPPKGTFESEKVKWWYRGEIGLTRDLHDMTRADRILPTEWDKMYQFEDGEFGGETARVKEAKIGLKGLTAQLAAGRTIDPLRGETSRTLMDKEFTETIGLDARVAEATKKAVEGLREEPPPEAVTEGLPQFFKVGTKPNESNPTNLESRIADHLSSRIRGKDVIVRLKYNKAGNKWKPGLDYKGVKEPYFVISTEGRAVYTTNPTPMRTVRGKSWKVTSVISEGALIQQLYKYANRVTFQTPTSDSIQAPAYKSEVIPKAPPARDPTRTERMRDLIRGNTQRLLQGKAPIRTESSTPVDESMNKALVKEQEGINRAIEQSVKNAYSSKLPDQGRMLNKWGEWATHTREFLTARGIMQRTREVVIKTQQVDSIKGEHGKEIGANYDRGTKTISYSDRLLQQGWNSYRIGGKVWTSREMLKPPPGLRSYDEFKQYMIQHERVHALTGIDGGFINENMANVLALYAMGGRFNKMADQLWRNIEAFESSRIRDPKRRFFVPAAKGRAKEKAGNVMSFFGKGDYMPGGVPVNAGKIIEVFRENFDGTIAKDKEGNPLTKKVWQPYSAGTSPYGDVGRYTDIGPIRTGVSTKGKWLFDKSGKYQKGLKGGV
ncbi:hypothetical protein LCGC14_1601050, partial [marine sediment metagenome]